MVFITKALIQDIPLLSEIGGVSIIESHGRSAPSHIMKAYVDEKFSEGAVEKELLDPANIFYLVYYKDQLAGYSKIIYNIPIKPVSQPNITKMERLYLLEKFHGLKLGHKLMDFNIQLSKEQNQAGMWLYVWKGNDRAINFYQRTGFSIVGDGFFRLTNDHSNPNWQMFLEY